MSAMDGWTEVGRLPGCDLDSEGEHGEAFADARVPGDGRWGSVCLPCFVKLGCRLGMGKGQVYVLRGRVQEGIEAAMTALQNRGDAPAALATLTGALDKVIRQSQPRHSKPGPVIDQDAPVLPR